MARLSYRRLFAWAVLCCALTALCGFGREFGLVIIILGIFAFPLFAHWLQAQSTTLSLDVIIGRLLLILLPLVSFMYAAYVGEAQNEASTKKHLRRISTNAWFNKTHEPAVVKYCGKKLVLKASVERILKQEKPPAQIILANCSGISFPEEEKIDGRVCFVIPESKEPVKIFAGDLLSVACYLRSGKFSVVSKNSVSSETSTYLEQHKKNFDVFSFVHPYDVRVLPKTDDIAFADIQPFILLCREQIAAGHEATMGQERGALLTSMVLGQNAVDLPKNIIDSFRNSGLSHIVAASGFNLSVVIMVTYFLIRPVNLPGNVSEYACLLMIVIYVALAGLSASIVRAGIMTSFIVVSRILQHRVRIGPVLAAALFVTCLPSPQALLDVGLQLSYVATIGIIVGAKVFADVINSSSNRIWQKCADVFSVTLIAQLSVLPIQLYYFGTLGLSFLPANLLVVPFVWPLTVGGFLGSFLILIGSLCPITGVFAFPLVDCIDFFLHFLLNYIIEVTKYFGDMQWTQIKIAHPSINAIAAYYACIACSLYLLRFPSKKVAAFTLMTLAIALVCLSII